MEKLGSRVDVNPEIEAKLLEIMANRSYWLKLTMKFGKGSLSPADCEDVLQEAFCLAVKNIVDFKGNAKLETWLAEILKNNVRMFFRARIASKRDERKTVTMESPEQFGSQGAESVEEMMMAFQKRIRLQEEISKLPTNHQTIIALLMEERDHQEIADITGMTYTAVSNQRLRAMRNLKDRLINYDEN